MLRGKRIKKEKIGGMKVSLAVLLFITLIVSTAAVVLAEDDGFDVIEVDGLPCKDDEVIVKFAQSESVSEIANAVESVDSEVQIALQDEIVVLDVPAGETVESFIDELKDMPGVEYAQPNYVYELEATAVDDPYVVDASQWHLGKIGVFDAWDTTMGAGVIVAVLDTGVDLSHPDLAGQILMHTDVVDDDNDAQDDHGHGTHVSGTIAAVQNNSLGGAGVAPDVQLIVVDIFSKYQEDGEDKWTSSTSDSIEAINYAVSNGAQVVSMSFGGYGNDLLFKNAIDTATAAGVVCVGASGNDNSNITHYPSDYDSCISVIATDSSDLKADYSNYGPQKDLAAPGSLIRATYIGGGYVYMSGTSMATPVVSGVVALMLSANEDLTVDEVKTILYSTAVDLGAAGKDDLYGNGRVDAAAAVAKAADGIIVMEVSLDKETMDITVDGTGALTATVYPDTAADKTISWGSDDELVATVADGVVLGIGAGTANITVTTNDGGFTDTCAVTVHEAGAASVSLDISELNINAGENQTLTAALLPANAWNKDVAWTSDNTDVATVDGGVVTGVGAGSATVRVTTQDGGHFDECEVFVTAVDIESIVYTTNQMTGYLSGVLEETSVAALEANLTNDPADIYVYDGSAEYTGEVIETGMTMKLIISGVTTDELTIVVTGDCNGDGAVSITDYTMIRLDILELKDLEDAFLESADINKDGSVSITDYTLIRLHILELKLIE